MRILCIGDSNTWGYNPANGLRFHNRWTKVLSSLMPDNEIIEEGLNGRTLLSPDPFTPERLGISALRILLMTHKPVDRIIIMLGTNELKDYYNSSADYIAEGIEQFIQTIQDATLWQRFNIPQILVISPVLIREELLYGNCPFSDFNETSLEQSKLMAATISQVCSRYNVDFMNAADYAEASLTDCIHLDEANHSKLAHAIYIKLTELS